MNQLMSCSMSNMVLCSLHADAFKVFGFVVVLDGWLVLSMRMCGGYYVVGDSSQHGVAHCKPGVDLPCPGT
ncbi:hypothetical protein ACVBEG_27755 [Pseudomonas sp. GG8]